MYSGNAITWKLPNAFFLLSRFQFQYEIISFSCRTRKRGRCICEYTHLFAIQVYSYKCIHMCLIVLCACARKFRTVSCTFSQPLLLSLSQPVSQSVSQSSTHSLQPVSKWKRKRSKGASTLTTQSSVQPPSFRLEPRQSLALAAVGTTMCRRCKSTRHKRFLSLL